MSFHDVLTSIVLALHLWCIGLACSAPFFALCMEWRESRGEVALGELGRRLSLAGIVTFVLGMVIGLFYGWTLYDPDFASALGRLKSRVFFGIIELVFSLCLFVLHRWWWGRRPNVRTLERAARMFVLFLAATNIAYHSPTFFAVLNQLRAETLIPEQPLPSAEFRQMIVGPAILSQVIHFLLAAVMIGASVLLWLVQDARHAAHPAMQASMVRMSTFIIGMTAVVQLVVGTWVSINLPATAQTQFANFLNPIAITLMISLLASVALIPNAFWTLVSPTPSSRSRWLTLHVALVVLLMSFVSRLLGSV